jgi:hypothetical protein
MPQAMTLAGKERASMAHFVVNAVASQHVGDFLIVVSVASADDFHPRSGLRRENFRVTQLATRDDDTVVERPVAAVAEGPDGVYRLRLASIEGLPQQQPGRYVLVVAVSAPPHGGGADYHGQTLAVGDLV